MIQSPVSCSHTSPAAAAVPEQGRFRTCTQVPALQHPLGCAWSLATPALLGALEVLQQTLWGHSCPQDGDISPGEQDVAGMGRDMARRAQHCCGLRHCCVHLMQRLQRCGGVRKEHLHGPPADDYFSQVFQALVKPRSWCRRWSC